MSPRRSNRPNKRRKVEHTEDFQEILPLCWWPEQEEYELIRPLVLFGDSAPERALETGYPERTLYEKVKDFGEDGVASLFATEPAKRQVLPLTIRRMILDLKSEYPPFSANEISKICYARSGRAPDRHTVQKVLSEEALQLKANRRFEPYHETPRKDGSTSSKTEGRTNIVTLHYEGWADKAIAGYLEIDRSTVYRVIQRWLEEGPAGLEDKPRGRPKGVEKVDLRAILAVKEIQENPELGAYRVKAALEQVDIYLGERTVGRILAMNRETYGLGKPARSPHQKKQLPFEATRRHQIWTADVRYLKTDTPEQLYCISVLENYSRKILASNVSYRQNQAAFLKVLYEAVERYGAPEKLLTDGGGIFRADRALSIYEALGIEKVEIEPRQPWQSPIETTFNIQHRMLDYYLKTAETFDEAVGAHTRWVENYNAQRHSAHENREDKRRSPEAVLGFYERPRYHPEYLRRAFLQEPFERVIDSLGYVRIMHWRLLGNEALARREVVLWVSSEELTIEYAGQPLSRYEVEYDPTVSRSFVGRLRRVKSPTLFEMSMEHVRLAQLRLFDLDEALGEEGWLRVLKVSEYAFRQPHLPNGLQQELFPRDEEEAV